MPAVADPLTTTLAALADPTRRAILARLAKGEASVTELAAPFAMSMPAITKHLKVLERAGLLTRSQRAQWRPCQLRPEGLQPAAAWLERYRELWEQRLDRLEAYVAQLQAPAAAEADAAKPPTRRHPHSHPRRRKESRDARSRR